MNIALVGLPGAGKSTAGKALAETLGLAFVDTDDLVEEETGCSVREVFSGKGEAEFRRLESSAIRRACAMDKAVVSCGGGGIVSEANRRLLLSNCITVHLCASPEKAASRIGNAEGRPLLEGNPPARVEELWNERKTHYSKAHLQVDANGTPEETLSNVRAALEREVVLCGVVAGEDAVAQISSVSRAGARAAELRLDLMPSDWRSIDEAIKACRKNKLKCVATLRDRREGGMFAGSESEKRLILERAIESGASVVDVELRHIRLIESIRQTAEKSGCRLIVSVHDTEGTIKLDSLRSVLRKISSIGGMAKIAASVSPENGVEFLGLLDDAEALGVSCVLSPMGKESLPLRIAAALRGSALNFAHAGIPTAAGQPSISEFSDAINTLRGRAWK
ncbi:MAG: type I 3-dehydroquinate dehydratase [Candidatus Micrarchaeota archaeon]